MTKCSSPFFLQLWNNPSFISIHNQCAKCKTNSGRVSVHIVWENKIVILQADNTSPWKPHSFVEGSTKATGEQRDPEYRRKYRWEGLSSQIPVHSVFEEKKKVCLPNISLAYAFAGNICSGKSEMPEPSRQHSQEQRVGGRGRRGGNSPSGRTASSTAWTRNTSCPCAGGRSLEAARKQTSHPLQRSGSPSLPTTSVYTKEGCWRTNRTMFTGSPIQSLKLKIQICLHHGGWR